MKKISSLSVFCLSFLPLAAGAAELKVAAPDADGVHLTVYSQNTALVHLNKKISLPQGISDIRFEGVAEHMIPQTSLVAADGLRVLEKSYEYNLLNQENLLSAFVGKQVKTVRINPADGKNIFENAVLLNTSFGAPLLKFSYGVEANFPGRIVFESLPENLIVKPTLVAQVDSPTAGEKNLELSYLTNGLQWSTNYVAELSGKNRLFLQAWADIDNQSGTDFVNAEVTLFSGKVQTESSYAPPRMMMLAAKNVSASFDSVSETAAPALESAFGHYVYALPQKISLSNKQSKQLSLWEKADVLYEPLYKISSSLSPQGSKKFEKTHASLVQKITNTAQNNLGVPLPQGKMRFYEKDSNGNTRFLGTSFMKPLAVGEEAELAIGESYDVYADGTIEKVSKIAEKTTESDYKITFYNASEEPVEVVFTQNVYGEAQVVSESLKSTRKDASELVWQVSVPAKGETPLTYKIRISRN